MRSNTGYDNFGMCCEMVAKVQHRNQARDEFWLAATAANFCTCCSCRVFKILRLSYLNTEALLATRRPRTEDGLPATRPTSADHLNCWPGRRFARRNRVLLLPSNPPGSGSSRGIKLNKLSCSCNPATGWQRVKSLASYAKLTPLARLSMRSIKH